MLITVALSNIMGVLIYPSMYILTLTYLKLKVDLIVAPPVDNQKKIS